MITTALCDWFRYLQLDDGSHRRDDEYRMALYTAEADLGRHTRSYVTAGEVVGQGYTAGGILLTGRKVQLLPTAVVLDWATPTWDPSTITARGFLIYNDSLEERAAVMTYDFGKDVTSTNGPFTPRMPVPGASTSLVQWLE